MKYRVEWQEEVWDAFIVALIDKKGVRYKIKNRQMIRGSVVVDVSDE